MLKRRKSRRLKKAETIRIKKNQKIKVNWDRGNLWANSYLRLWTNVQKKISSKTSYKNINFSAENFSLFLLYELVSLVPSLDLQFMSIYIYYFFPPPPVGICMFWIAPLYGFSWLRLNMFMYFNVTSFISHLIAEIKP